MANDPEIKQMVARIIDLGKLLAEAERAMRLKKQENKRGADEPRNSNASDRPPQKKI